MHTRRYSAFISYRHADNTQEGRRWAEWLHRALERYVVPPDLIGTPNLRGDPIRDSLYPIFRDEDELPANADLATGIRAALEVSDHLIVLCSPRSAVSPWVRKEVREFKELGRSDRILAIIIAGEPNADDPAKARDGILRDEECFCEELRFGAVREDGTLDWTVRTEPLAADLRPVGTRAEGFVTAEAYREYLTLNSSLPPEKIATRAEAYRQQLDHGILKVAAGLLGVPLGQLIDRDAAHRAELAKKELERSQAEAARLRAFSRHLAIAGVAALILALLAGLLWWKAGMERTIAVEAKANAEIAQGKERTQKEKAEAIAAKLRLSDAKQEALLLKASYGDHEAALRAIEKQNYGEGQAYFARALDYAPKNTATLAASASFTFGTNAPSWITRSITSFGAEVKGIDISPNGQYFAAGSADNTARVFESASGKEIRRMEFDRGVESVSFSPDGRYLAAGSSDKTARVFEVASGREISKLVFGSIVKSVSFSPDGLYVAAGSYDKTARVFEAASGKAISKLEFGDTVYSVDFSPDGRYLATGSGDKTVRVFEAASGKEVSKLTFDSSVRSVNFSPDGYYLAAGSSDNTARIIETANGKEIRRMEFDRGVESVSFSPDGHFLAAGSDDKTARVFEVASGKEICKLLFGKAVMSVSFSPDERYLAACGEDNTVRVVETFGGKEVSRLVFGDRLTSVKFSPDGRYLVAGAYDRTVRVFENATGKTINMEAFDGNIDSLSFSPNGHKLAAGIRDGTARVIEAATGKEISKLVFGETVTSVSFSPDGRYVAAGSYDKTARVFDATSGKEVSKLTFGDTVYSVSFSPDGRYLTTGSGDKTVRVFEAASGKEVSKLTLGDTIYSLSCSPNGRYIAVVTRYNKTVQVIESASGKAIRNLSFGGPVDSVSFSPDGRYLAAGSYDGTARVFESTSGKETSRIKYGDAVLSLSFSSDGRYLAAGGGDKSARIFEVTNGKEICALEFKHSVLSVSFSPDRRYLAAGSYDRTVQVMDWTWVGSVDGATTSIWSTALGWQSGLRFQVDGQLQFIPADELDVDQAAVQAYANAAPPDGEHWQHAILKWSLMPPDTRTTSPWAEEPVRVAAGRWFMQSPNGLTIEDTASVAPWHPLEPVSLARLQRMNDRKTGFSSRTVLASDPSFLARLTLQRLRDADETLYGRSTLAEYATWAAKVMCEELNLYAEALEVITFALECATSDQRKTLLELKAKVNVAGSLRVVVTEIVRGGQAEALGLQAGDVYVTYNGQSITSAEQIIRLTNNSWRESIPLEVMRAGKRLAFTAKPGKLGTHIECRPMQPTTGAEPTK